MSWFRRRPKIVPVFTLPRESHLPVEPIGRWPAPELPTGCDCKAILFRFGSLHLYGYGFPPIADEPREPIWLHQNDCSLIRFQRECYAESNRIPRQPIEECE